MHPVQVARELRVSTKSAYQWWRRWRAGGEAALASRGPGGSERRLSETQLVRLRTELDQGPAAHGRDEDQRSPLARAAICPSSTAIASSRESRWARMRAATIA
jgi:transposase-like protein